MTEEEDGGREESVEGCGSATGRGARSDDGTRTGLGRDGDAEWVRFLRGAWTQVGGERGEGESWMGNRGSRASRMEEEEGDGDALGRRAGAAKAAISRAVKITAATVQPAIRTSSAAEDARDLRAGETERTTKTTRQGGRGKCKVIGGDDAYERDLAGDDVGDGKCRFMILGTSWIGAQD